MKESEREKVCGRGKGRDGKGGLLKNISIVLKSFEVTSKESLNRILVILLFYLYICSFIYILFCESFSDVCVLQSLRKLAKAKAKIITNHFIICCCWQLFSQ